VDGISVVVVTGYCRYVGQNQTLASKQLEFTKDQKVPFVKLLGCGLLSVGLQGFLVYSTALTSSSVVADYPLGF
jgi:hypothetical protein